MKRAGVERRRAKKGVEESGKRVGESLFVVCRVRELMLGTGDEQRARGEKEILDKAREHVLEREKVVDGLRTKLDRSEGTHEAQVEKELRRAEGSLEHAKRDLCEVEKKQGASFARF